MTVLETLIAAREKIAKPESWTKGSFARDENGRGVSEKSYAAVCWCALGAAFAAQNENDGLKFETVKLSLKQQLTPEWGYSVALFNDSHQTTHADVLALFDRAIESERAKP